MSKCYIQENLIDHPSFFHIPVFIFIHGNDFLIIRDFLQFLSQSKAGTSLGLVGLASPRKVLPTRFLGIEENQLDL